MSSNSQTRPDNLLNWSRRWRAALKTAALMVLVTSVIRLAQWLVTNSGWSTAVVKLTPGLAWHLPFAVHHGWDLVLGAVGSAALVLLITGPTNEREIGTLDECVDSIVVSMVLGLVASFVAAFLGLCAVLFAGMLVGVVRARARTSSLVGLVLAATYGSLVVSLVVGALVGFAAGIPAAVLYLSAHLLGAVLALIVGTLYPAKLVRSCARRIWDRFRRRRALLGMPFPSPRHRRAWYRRHGTHS